MKKRFILWDRKDGDFPPRNDDGEIITGGILGVLDEENAYLTAYAKYSEGGTHRSLEVGQRISATFTLSGGCGTYDVYRTR